MSTTMPFDQVLHAAEQLSPQEQTTLLRHLLEHTRQQTLSVTERMALLRAAQSDLPVNQEPSLRREDWYGETY